MNNTNSKIDILDNNDDGRLGRLDEHTLGYYRRVNETLSNPFDDDEDKEHFLKNVFKQLCSEAVEVTRNQTVSKIVEALVSHATNGQARELLQSLSQDWMNVATDRFASHVCQTSLLRAACTEVDSNCSSPTLERFMNDIFQLFTDDIAEYAMHVYASHIIKTLLEITSGVYTAKSLVKKKTNYKENFVDPHILKPNAKGTELFITICEKLLSMGKLSDHFVHYMSCPLIQTLLICVKGAHPKLFKPICAQIINRTNLFEITEDAINNVPDMLSDRCGSHMVEQLIATAGDEELQSLLDDHLQRHLVAMCVDPIANFVLQRIIVETRTPEQYTMVYKIIIDQLDNIMAKQHYGIIIKLAEMSKKHETRQKKLLRVGVKLLRGLMKALNCYEPSERQIKCLPLLLSLRKYDTYYTNEKSFPPLPSISIHGSLLVQHLFSFPDCQPLTDSLMSMTTADLTRLCRDKCGSFAVARFLGDNVETLTSAHTFTQNAKCPAEQQQPDTSPETMNKKKLFLNRILKEIPHIVQEAPGSRIVESIWKCIPELETRIQMAEVLSKADFLKTHKFGRFVYNKFGIENFKNRRNKWEIMQKEELAAKKNKSNLKDKENKNNKKRKHDNNGEINNKSNSCTNEDQQQNKKSKKKKFEKFQKKNRKT